MLYFVDRNYRFKRIPIKNGQRVEIFNLYKIKVIYLPFISNDNYSRITCSFTIKSNKTVYLQYDKFK